MSRLQHITFHTETGGEQTVTVQDYDNTNTLEFFGEPYKQAVSGYRHHRIRGQRKNIRVSYKACIESSEFRTLVNNIINDFIVKGLEVVRYSEGSSMSDTHELIPTERMLYKMEYAHQHGIFLPVLEFEGRDLITDTTITIEFEDWGLVTESVTETEGYGLITDSVTATEDYGSV